MAYSEFTFEIVKNIATLSTDKSGWTKELNLVSYNDAVPKYYIRTWDPDHQKMGKGVTLNNDEMFRLRAALEDLEL